MARLAGWMGWVGWGDDFSELSNVGFFGLGTFCDLNRERMAVFGTDGEWGGGWAKRA
jgi:hypothetical protein